MSDELIKRLRDEARAIMSSFAGDEDMYAYLFEAADLIEQQAARIAALESAEKEAVPVAEVIKWQTFTGHTAWDLKVFDKTIEHGAKLYAAPASKDAIPWCQACGDGITAHDPGVCGNCFAMKYRDSASKDAIRREALDSEPSLQALYEDVCIEANKNAQDARRYRWLRDFDVRCKDGVDINPPCEIVHASMYAHAVGTIPAVRLVTGGELDRAIDAALSQKVGDQQ